MGVKEEKMKKIFLPLTLCALAGCAAHHKMNDLHVGMTKREVTQTLGAPYSTSAKDDTEYLTYALWKDFWDRYPGGYSDFFFVRIKDGKVDAFGRVGDFDSTKVPEQKTTIDLNIKNDTQSTTVNGKP